MITVLTMLDLLLPKKRSLNGKASRASELPINSCSWTFTDHEPVKYDHAWRITNFDKMMGMKSGSCIKSGNFRISFKGKPTDWYLSLYPNGENFKIRDM